MAIPTLPKSYKETFGSSNSTRLLNKIDSENGYIVLYTELDSHLLPGDNVYVSSNNTTVSPLDNYSAYISSDDFPFTKFNKGYKVVSVDVEKNKVVIDKLYSDLPTTFDLTGHYLSTIKGQNAIITNSNIDSAYFYQLAGTNDFLIQSIIINANITGCTFSSKYDFNYITLKRFEIGDLIVNDNNYTYGYNYVGVMGQTHTLLYNNIQNGNFFSCQIIGQTGNYIRGGYFESCVIDNYVISGGYFKNCIIYSSCTWNNGSWNGAGSDFYPTLWSNGNWYTGTFSAKTWLNGNFNSGTFTDSIWNNGTFVTGTFQNSYWYGGFFTDGILQNSVMSGGTFNNGTLSNTLMTGVTINNGSISNITANNLKINYAVITTSTIYNTNVYAANIDTSVLYDCMWYNGGLYNSYWYGGTWYDGFFVSSYFVNGTWRNGNFNASNWYQGDWYNGSWNNSRIYDLNPFDTIKPYINWYNGEFNGGYGDDNAYFNWYGGTFNNGTFIGRNETSITTLVPWALI